MVVPPPSPLPTPPLTDPFLSSTVISSSKPSSSTSDLVLPAPDPADPASLAGPQPTRQRSPVRSRPCSPRSAAASLRSGPVLPDVADPRPVPQQGVAQPAPPAVKSPPLPVHASDAAATVPPSSDLTSFPPLHQQSISHHRLQSPPACQSEDPLHPPPILGAAPLPQPGLLSAASPQLHLPSDPPCRPASSTSRTAASPSGPSSSSPPSSSAPQQQTYAQVARNSRGPGFVRSHASDVESFARLPRTGFVVLKRECHPSLLLTLNFPKLKSYMQTPW